MTAHSVRDFMTPNPTFCTPDSFLHDVARLMTEHNCGAIPVVEDLETKVPVGIITDRDITCRSVARGKDPLAMRAGACMSTPVVSITPEARLEDSVRLMEEHRVRRLLVVDADGRCCGIVTQADIAQVAPEGTSAQLLRRISYPPQTPSRAETAPEAFALAASSS